MSGTSLRRRKTWLALALTAALAWGLAALASDGSQPPPRHHRASGYQNNYEAFEPVGWMGWLRWQLESASQGLPKPPQAPVPVVEPDLAFIHANASAGPAMEPTFTWIGHATVLAQVGGLNIITDPMFSERASPVGFAGPRRHARPGVSLAHLPHVDVVLVSHNHLDHLDEPSVRALGAQAGGSPLFIVPLGNGAWFAERGLTRVVELDWWHAHSVGGVEFVLTPVQHWSARGLQDPMKTLWGGFAVFAPDFQFFFAGDTAYSPDFKDIRTRFEARQGNVGFDLALIPIGAYAPRWFMSGQHVDPTEAVQIHQDLLARRSVGIHWGTFELTDESLDEPPQELARARRSKGIAEADFTVMAIGETRRLPRRLHAE